MRRIGKDITKRNKMACSSNYTPFAFYEIMCSMCNYFSHLITTLLLPWIYTPGCVGIPLRRRPSRVYHDSD